MAARGRTASEKVHWPLWLATFGTGIYGGYFGAAQGVLMMAFLGLTLKETIQRQNALTNARNAELRAETDYNKALADLQRATSTTLRVNNVMVDAAPAP